MTQILRSRSQKFLKKGTGDERLIVGRKVFSESDFHIPGEGHALKSHQLN